ncbi:MAG: WxcM-like domain-containing protein [Muribaculaceae bacterium]|nr:WxcM-like domain-containing protein [Muribaculaceae bacterium]
MKNNSVHDCLLIELDRNTSDRRGTLSVVGAGGYTPFDIKRAYYLYDVPGGESRGGHSHKTLHELIVAVSGSFTVTLDDGTDKKSICLNRPYEALYIMPGIWRTLEDFSSGAVCVVLASELFSEDDYIRDYNTFLNSKTQRLE